MPQQSKATESVSVDESSAEAPSLYVAGTFTVDPLAERLGHWLRLAGLDLEVELGPYNQVHQQLLDPNGELARHPGPKALLVRWHDLAPRAGSTADVEAEVDALCLSLERASEHLEGSVLLILSGEPESIDGSVSERLDERCRRRLSGVRGVEVLDSRQIASWYPVERPDDAVSSATGHVPYSDDYFLALSAALTRCLSRWLLPPKKVVVVDCDNTLWSGVVGEVGQRGVELRESHLALQSFLVRQMHAGRLICLCSKNAEEDVLEVFRERSEMQLGLDHLVGWKVNWQTKSSNLIELADELDLALDSFVFIDDSPLECAEVSAALPQVTVLRPPENETDVRPWLRQLWCLDHDEATPEDRGRTRSYRENSLRRQHRAEAPTVASFLESLELEVSIESPELADFERLSQLSKRTNQFNSSGHRWSAEQLRSASEEPATQLLKVAARDRFGDYGIVGLVVAWPKAGALEVDTLLMSCRALGRGIEHELFESLAQLARDHELSRIEVPVRTTDRNEPVRRFLASLRASAESTGKGEESYGLHLDQDFRASLSDEAAKSSAEERRAARTGPDPRLPSALIAGELSSVEGMRRRFYPPRPRPETLGDRVAARTTLEECVAFIWCEVLGYVEVGALDGWQELGGRSIDLVRVHSRLVEATSTELELTQLFDLRTVRETAAAIEARKARPRALRSDVRDRASRIRGALFQTIDSKRASA